MSLASRKNKNFLITGGNFCNKGAQAMLFETVDQIRRRYPDADILFQTGEMLNVSGYKFRLVHMNPDTVSIILKEKGYMKTIIRRFFKEIIKYIIGRREGVFSAFKEIDEIKSVDVIIDISGYAIGDKWAYKQNEEFVKKIEMARLLDIPIYLMPQSFGRVEFVDESEANRIKIKNNLRNALSYVSIIYAREEESMRNLKDIGVSNNVFLSKDMVLSISNIEWSNVYQTVPIIKKISIENAKNIAIVPNTQLMRRASEKEIFELYSNIIRLCVDNGYNVYILSHSDEDKEICETIYEKNCGNGVHLINVNLDCREYESFIANIDLQIGSRYHGIVHALKQGVPCIALGWDKKYKELMKWVGQDDCVFDGDMINSQNKNGLINKLSEVLSSLELRKKTIMDKVKEIQTDSNFDFLDKL